MKNLLSSFPSLPFGIKPKLVYIDKDMVVGLVEEEKFIGLVYWDGASVSYNEYKIFPIIEK